MESRWKRYDAQVGGSFSMIGEVDDGNWEPQTDGEQRLMEQLKVRL